MAGVCAGDLIISCNSIPVRSPVQFSDLLLRMGKSHCERKVKRRAKAIEVVIQRPSTLTTIGKSIKFEAFTPSNINKWPDLPLDISDNNCGNVVLFSSQEHNSMHAFPFGQRQPNFGGRRRDSIRWNHHHGKLQCPMPQTTLL
ncbi:uncharacterized protein LOC141658502 [Silene latifolia]|uniref:uncharacterized protein LOC141658502 n=1 Tax=Silene latifolia TaxID=37657 RepID=UPI003D78658B